MRGVFLSLILAMSFVACKTDKQSQSTTKSSTTEISSDTVPVISLTDFETKAGNWVGKEVQVTGIVDHVCKHGGKRLLLVDDDHHVHIDSETRFDDNLMGSNITVNGLVTEFKVDEAYCLQKEQNCIQKHKDGTDAEDIYNEKIKQIQSFRDSMKTAGVDHLSFYSIDYLSHKVNK